MEKEIIGQFKTKLLEEKNKIENDIKATGAVRNKTKGRWRIKIPFFGSWGVVEQNEKADQVEEYIGELSMEKELETSLKDIDSALEKIEKGNYGTCEKCGKEIEIERLEANPEARTHTKC